VLWFQDLEVKSLGEEKHIPQENLYLAQVRLRVFQTFKIGFYFLVLIMNILRPQTTNKLV